MAQPDLLTRREIAAVLGVDERSVTNYAQASPPIPRSVHGRSVRYPLAPCVRWFVEYRVEQAVSDGGPSELDLARQRKTSADARLAELDVAEREGDLVPIAVVERTVGGLCDELRARITAFTGRVAPLVVGVPDVAEATAIVAPVVHELLEVLSRTAVPVVEIPNEEAA